MERQLFELFRYHIIKIYEGTESVKWNKKFIRMYHIIKIYEGTESLN